MDGSPTSERANALDAAASLCRRVTSLTSSNDQPDFQFLSLGLSVRVPACLLACLLAVEAATRVLSRSEERVDETIMALNDVCGQLRWQRTRRDEQRCLHALALALGRASSGIAGSCLEGMATAEPPRQAGNIARRNGSCGAQKLARARDGGMDGLWREAERSDGTRYRKELLQLATAGVRAAQRAMQMDD